ncbi:MAG TPA: DM9 repeat-containing protein [Kofleriaceae bacterium]
MTAQRQLALALTVTLGLSANATADPAGEQYAAIAKLVQESGIVQLLASERQDANSIHFLVLATPKRYAPSLILSDAGGLWITLPDLRNRTIASPGDLLRYNISLDVVKEGIAAARKQKNLFVDPRRKNDMPAGTAAPYVVPLTWRSPKAMKDMKEKPVIAGREHGVDLAVCRGLHGSGKHPGKVIGDKCYYGWGGKEHATTEFDYFVPQAGERFSWQTVAKGDIARKEVPSGFEPGRNLPVCRAAHQGATHPGKVFEGKCHIGFAGKEIGIADFEALVRATD